MSFISHINNITSKATRTLNFVKQNLCNCSQQTKSRAYTSLVRPTLEYASSMWDPYHNNHIASIEKIQRRALRWIFDDYNYNHSVTTMLQSLNWPTLQHRRKRMRLILLYKSINGLLALKIPYRFPQIQEFIIINPIISHISEQMPTWTVFFPNKRMEWSSSTSYWFRLTRFISGTIIRHLF